MNGAIAAPYHVEHQTMLNNYNVNKDTSIIDRTNGYVQALILTLTIMWLYGDKYIKTNSYVAKACINPCINPLALVWAAPLLCTVHLTRDRLKSA